MHKSFIPFIFLFLFRISYAQNTEVKMLSGSGFGDTVEWDFFCSEGRNSGVWKKIDVPSQWELQGFGEYTYGRWYKKPGVKNPSREYGIYKYKFDIPKSWKGKHVDIVFEGVMTDTEVKINGKLAGDVHQGGFYRFRYDVSDLTKFGQKNELEVKVNKHSAEKSVNNAERRADWWLFGGIYRPVYLEAKPQLHIERVAVDAASDGSILSDIYLSSDIKGKKIIASLRTLSDDILGKQEFAISSSDKKQILYTEWKGVKTWTCEDPNLYYLQFDLADDKGNIIHSHKERIGFRTVEFKKHDGLYVNGTKVLLKGINRHSFWPAGGRCTNREISLKDALLIKEMNINAVRFHYPPDTHFLEMCDSLGIFVVDELAGWQNSYRTETGKKLLAEMVKRDVNHPSIILWSNGNEGGWNTQLDTLFAEYDPQKRHVIHPWADFDGLDTHHYPEYQTGVARFNNGYNVFMSTEFMHGLYDQGHGAGLEDFWKKYTSSPFFLGGFLWDFSDNAVVRTDLDNKLDSDNNLAADGILGPYREKEGSFYSVREIWSPIQIQPFQITESFNGDIYVKNDYIFSSLKGCYLEYSVKKIQSPINDNTSVDILRLSGKVDFPDIQPKETKRIAIPVTKEFFEGDVLEIKLFDKNSKEICTKSYPIKSAKEYFAEQHKEKNTGISPNIKTDNNLVNLSWKELNIEFSAETGMINKIMSKGDIIPLTNGPVPIGMATNFKNCKVRKDDKNAFFTAYYEGMLDSVQWKLDDEGLLTMQAVMLRKAGKVSGFDDAFSMDKISNFGFSFDYPENDIKGAEWFGRGPYRVWKNRIPGANFGLWQKDYNNTITGESFENLIYPEFKGYHANMYWCTFQSRTKPFTVYSQSDGVFLRLFTPEEPKGRENGVNTMPGFPVGDISFFVRNSGYSGL
ncbi:MAG: glycoside hydrolase family 2 TIM barrel-domain containing protein [Dysgonomonas sp.]